MIDISRGMAAVALGLCLSATAHARPADCIDLAGATHGVSSAVLRAIVQVESGGNPRVVARNRNGTIDIGYTQINSVHLPELARYGIRPADLLDACTNVFVRAWLYRKKIDKYGNTWEAIGATHSETPHLRNAYARRVAQVLAGVIAAVRP